VIPQVLLLFILGLCFGSFLNVVIYRLPKNKSLFGRSYCDNCKRKLSFFDLIPLLSFVFLKGKCRYCKKKIDPIIPIVELITGILFATTILKFPVFSPSSLLNLIYYLFILSSLVSIFFIDIKNGIIPNKITYPAIFLTFIFVFFDQRIIESFLTAFLTALFFFLLYIFTRRRGMGFGDIKLVFLIGLFLGFLKIIFSLYIAFLTGAFVSLILILWGKKKFSKDSIAFGPFLVLGAIITVFLGDLLVSLLSNFLSL